MPTQLTQAMPVPAATPRHHRPALPATAVTTVHTSTGRTPFRGRTAEDVRGSWLSHPPFCSSSPASWRELVVDHSPGSYLTMPTTTGRDLADVQAYRCHRTGFFRLKEFSDDVQSGIVALRRTAAARAPARAIQLCVSRAST